jgi:hypothetical protein
VEASYRNRLGKLEMRAAAQAGRLRRLFVSQFAPPGLRPVGTSMWMGRGELAASVRLVRDVDVTATAWLERSDRDDPRWLVPADGTLDTHAGGEVNARWRFQVQ